MKRFTLAVALGLAIIVPGLAHASPANPESLCTFERRVNYYPHIRPANPCGGGPLTLVVESCAECDNVVSGALTSSGAVALKFESQVVCPLIPCIPDSVEVPLGSFRPGHYSIVLEVTAHVPSDSLVGGCEVHQRDVFTFDVERCPPPPGTLPFVRQLTIGRPSPCLECPPIACPGDSIPVSVSGVFPDNCFLFLGLRLGPSPLAGPRPQPPVLVILVGVCRYCPCAQVPSAFHGSIELPGLPSGSYTLPVDEVWLDHADTTRVDSTFHANFPFNVVERCSTITPPGCILVDFMHGGGLCDVNVDREHPGVATLTLQNAVPLAGIQGELSFYPAGLEITAIEPAGSASHMRLAWQPRPNGAKFVLFSTDGSVIPPSDSVFRPVPILRVTVALAGDEPPAPVSVVIASALVASDPNGNQVIECPTFRFAPPEARICVGGRLCDINHDGVADVRDLVLMVHCILGTGPCPDSGMGSLDCNGDSLKTLDDVMCCARAVLREGMPDTAARRNETGVQLSFGLPVGTGGRLDVPVHIEGADRLGAARLTLRFPSDRFEVQGVELSPGTSDWLALHEVQGGDLIVGLIGLSPGSGDAGRRVVDLTLHLMLRPGQQPGGNLRLASGDFSAPDGAALAVNLTSITVPIGDAPRLDLSAAQPNPFSRTTQFSVTLPRAGDAELTVHDLAGRRVATLFRGRLEAGTRAFAWAGTGDGGDRVRDGIYFVRVRGVGDDVTRKVLLLRRN